SSASFSVVAQLSSVTSALSLHDALPIYLLRDHFWPLGQRGRNGLPRRCRSWIQSKYDSETYPPSSRPIFFFSNLSFTARGRLQSDRKSTRLNSSHRTISYAVFCLKKKKQ